MTEADAVRWPRWPTWLLFLGVYLTFHGYHSRDGDQAYRLPLLLHRQDPRLFSGDPFVRAFDAFNPHRGYLALLDAASRFLGLSAALFALYAATFFVTCLGLDRLARATWPCRGPRIGLIAAALVLTAKAGNVGTNHLFEPMLLDRLIALGLGWWAMGASIDESDAARPGWRSAAAIGVATWVHPSMGLQIAGLLAVAWLAWTAWPGAGVGVRRAVSQTLWLGVGIAPSAVLMAHQAGALRGGLPDEEFRLIAAGIQSPQHMLPHLWRMPQWLAAGCYPVLAGLSLLGGARSIGRTRLAILLAVNLVLLGLAWVAVEVVQDLRMTLFQPFRLATVARGLSLVIVSGKVSSLWQSGRWGEARAAVLVAGLTGDWALVVATAVELAASIADVIGVRAARAGAVLALGAGAVFLSRHDTESGHVRLLIAPMVGLVASRLGSLPTLTGRPAAILTAAWTIPVASFVAACACGAAATPGWVGRLADYCRFGDRPIDDIERLGLWCRDHTPPDARFIGPPGPKTFRLWSRRDVAFNRAASPYHAAGLADWAARFKAHVAFEGSTAAFARSYLRDRRALEHRFDRLSDSELAKLAISQGSEYVLSAAPRSGDRKSAVLSLLHSEGNYAVYRVRRPEILAVRGR